MKIVTISVFREEIPMGIARQLLSEHNNRNAIDPVHWTTIALTTKKIDLPFARRVPPVFRLRYLYFLYAWIIVFRLSKTHDFVLIRYMVDPFGWLIAPFIKNWMSVHHINETQWLKQIKVGASGKAIVAAEAFLARRLLPHAAGIIGVTPEIAEYERTRSGASAPIGTYLNGIDMNDAPVVADLRHERDVVATFMCDTFFLMHGLDKLFAAVRIGYPEAREAGLRIHLIGALLPEHIAELEGSEELASIFVPHGRLQRSDYEPLLAASDLAIGSLAVERVGLREAATLKVREMLAAGLPFYSGHVDAALPADFAYYRIAEEPDIADLIALARRFKAVSRVEVREAAAPYIRKDAVMKRVAEWLGGLRARET